MGRPAAAPEDVGGRALQGPGQGSGPVVGILLFLLLQAAHLEDLCSCPELVAFIPVGKEVNGLAYVVPGILDLKRMTTERSVGWASGGRDANFTVATVSRAPDEGPSPQGSSSLDGWGGYCLPEPSPPAVLSVPSESQALTGCWAHGTDCGRPASHSSPSKGQMVAEQRHKIGIHRVTCIRTRG